PPRMAHLRAGTFHLEKTVVSLHREGNHADLDHRTGSMHAPSGSGPEGHLANHLRRELFWVPAAASVGPATVGVGNCRVNLLGFGLDVAERFTWLWEQASGSTYHPWADVVAIVGFLDGLQDGPGSDGFVTGVGRARRRDLTLYLGTGFTLALCAVPRSPTRPG
ncbi:MAG: hypothetical protein ACRDYC_10850, partial [Acidimicrobiales bacterium]